MRARRSMVPAVLVASLVGAAPAAGAPGDLDRSFGARGKVMLGGRATDVVVQPDRKMVILRNVRRRDDPVVVVTRLRADGGLDKRFGRRGHTRIRVNEHAQHPVGLALRPDGRIVVAFNTQFPGPPRPGLARLRPSGKLDRSFGGDGVRLTRFANHWMEPSDLALGRDGGSVVAGTAIPVSVGGTMHALARYDSAGRLDDDFSGDGRVINDVTEADDAIAAGVVDSQDRVVVTGWSWSGTSAFRMTIGRYGADGELDPSFGGGVFEASGRYGKGTDVALLAGDDIVVTGWLGFRSSEFVLMRRDADGGADTGFGAGGTSVVGFPRRADRASALAVDSGALVAAGTTQTPRDTRGEWAIARVLHDGSLDPTFSKNGRRLVDFGRGPDAAADVAVDRRGDIVVVGRVGHPGGTEHVAAVIRLKG